MNWSQSAHFPVSNPKAIWPHDFRWIVTCTLSHTSYPICFGTIVKVFPMLVASLLKLIQAQITSWFPISKNTNNANLQEQSSLCSLTSRFFLVINIAHALHLKWQKLWKPGGSQESDLHGSYVTCFWALSNLSDYKSAFPESKLFLLPLLSLNLWQCVVLASYIVPLYPCLGHSPDSWC